jgi:hypothetical protein
MNNTLKYVYIDSRKRKSTDKKNNLTVTIPQGLDNCSRIALKSFSIPNTFPNMINKKLQWIEFLATGTQTAVVWKAALFEINFDDLSEEQIYLDNQNLALEIQSQFTNQAGNKIFKYPVDEVGDGQIIIGNSVSQIHQVDTESALNLTITYNSETYKYNIVGAQSTKHKIMVLFDDELGGSLWTSLGFSKEKLMKVNDVSGFLQVLKGYVKDFNGQIPPAPIPNAEVFNQNKGFIDKFHLRDMYNVGANTVALRTIQAPFVSRHENDINEINLCSDLAESLITGNNGVCIPTDILEKIINDVPKYSYIHHTADTLYYHQLPKNNINHFNLRLLNHNYELINDAILPDWQAVLIFEQTHEIEYHKEDIIAYAEEAYRKGHPVLNR